ncbi:class I SAM-dependent DNA methyltransferase, partial [Pseudoxanthomonas sp. SGD-10]
AEPVRDLFGNITESQMKMTFSKSETINEIQKLIKQFFTIEISEEKQAIRQKINGLVLQHIEYNIELRENQLNRFINEAGKPESLKAPAKKKYDGYLADLAKIQDTKTQLLKIQETDERPYFLWHLYFMDVFEQGGFDVMIGNPPYIQLQSMGSQTDILENANFKTFTRRGDVYCLFYEKGFELLKDKGTLVYITSNKWMRGGYGKSLREFFSEVNTQRIINLGPGIFHSATVDTNIYLGQKSKFKNIVKGIAIDNRNLLESLKSDSLIPMTDVNSDAWIVLDKNELLINQYFDKNGKPLREWNIKINFGIKTGFNEAYLIDDETKERLIKSDIKSRELIKPLARGRDIERFSI